MGTQLTQIVAFTAIEPATPTALPHNINVNGRALIPDLAMRDNGDFEITAVDTTSVTVVNNGDAAADCNVWLQYQHSHDRWFGAAQTTQLTPAPFIPAGGGSGSGGSTREYEPTLAGPEALANGNNDFLETTITLGPEAERFYTFIATASIHCTAGAPGQVNDVIIAIVQNPGTKGEVELTRARASLVPDGGDDGYASLSCQAAFISPSGSERDRTYVLRIIVDTGGEATFETLSGNSTIALRITETVYVAP